MRGKTNQTQGANDICQVDFGDVYICTCSNSRQRRFFLFDKVMVLSCALELTRSRTRFRFVCSGRSTLLASTSCHRPVLASNAAISRQLGPSITFICGQMGNKYRCFYFQLMRVQSLQYGTFLNNPNYHHPVDLCDFLGTSTNPIVLGILRNRMIAASTGGTFNANKIKTIHAYP